MACSYCNIHKAQYVEESEKLLFCSYTCHCLYKSANADNHLSLYMNAKIKDSITMKPLAERPTNFGPEAERSYNIPEALRRFILTSTAYMAGLSLFEQYIVWRYTLGSTPINGYLIFGRITNADNAIEWTYKFFDYWRNTCANCIISESVLPSFVKFARFFREPGTLYGLEEGSALLITERLIPIYIEALSSIIREAPPVENAFHVFKVASAYPGLPENAEDVPKEVPQKPFNSTTINPHFNFALYSSPEASGNIFDLRICRGSRVLYVPAEYHAYPHEKEIILPPNSLFTITAVQEGSLDVVDPETVNLVELQPEKNIVMGPVKEPNTYRPCKGEGGCEVTRKLFRIFISDYTGK